ncbi:unnamed protein product [Lampetra planeri]
MRAVGARGGRGEEEGIGGGGHRSEHGASPLPPAGRNSGSSLRCSAETPMVDNEEALNEENESPRDGGQGEGGLWPGAGVSRERSERLRGRWRGLSGEAAWRVVAPPLGGRRLATEP